METSDRTKTHSSSTTLLSNTALQECRGKGVRKSYPGKTSSTDIFLMNARRSIWWDSTEKGGKTIFSNTNTGQERTSLVEPSTPGSSVYMEGNEAVPTENIEERAYQSIAHLSSVTNKASRFLSIDLPLTDIPERESESEKVEEPGLASVKNTLSGTPTKTRSVDSCETIKSKSQKSQNFRQQTTVMETTFSAGDPSTSKSSQFHLSSDNKDLKNASQNLDDTTNEQQMNLFQSLRKTLDKLKRTYEIPDSESLSVSPT
uniref:Uncharacterized protein n=1 Tax=Romanomermis culicivorax TaxID=13658 RepID=A0A915L385_ROMCU